MPTDDYLYDDSIHSETDVEDEESEIEDDSFGDEDDSSESDANDTGNESDSDSESEPLDSADPLSSPEALASYADSLEADEAAELGAQEVAAEEAKAITDKLHDRHDEDTAEQRALYGVWSDYAENWVGTAQAAFDAEEAGQVEAAAAAARDSTPVDYNSMTAEDFNHLIAVATGDVPTGRLRGALPDAEFNRIARRLTGSNESEE